MSIYESDVRKIMAEVQATSWRLRECIRVRELATTHGLGQMRRLRMLEEQKAWKREDGFDRIEITAEMDEQRLRIGFDLQPFYTKLYNPRWPHTPEGYTLEMRVDVKRLKIEILLSQPAPPPQCDSSPRRLPAVDTGSEEPGTPRRLPSVRGPMNPEYRELEVGQQRGKGFSLFKPAWMVLCASTAQARSKDVFCFNQTLR